MKLSPTSGHPYQALAADIVTQIQRGDLKPDDQLPPIRALAREYGVTIATAQRAVQQLAIDGHVRTVPNLGSFVLTPPADQVRVMTVDDVSRRVDDLSSELAAVKERLRRLEESGGEAEQRST
jgi:GntR family transcriptional regulator